MISPSEFHNSFGCNVVCVPLILSTFLEFPFELESLFSRFAVDWTLAWSRVIHTIDISTKENVNKQTNSDPRRTNQEYCLNKKHEVRSYSSFIWLDFLAFHGVTRTCLWWSVELCLLQLLADIIFNGFPAKINHWNNWWNSKHGKHDKVPLVCKTFDLLMLSFSNIYCWKVEWDVSLLKDKMWAVMDGYGGICGTRVTVYSCTCIAAVHLNLVTLPPIPLITTVSPPRLIASLENNENRRRVKEIVII